MKVLFLLTVGVALALAEEPSPLLRDFYIGSTQLSANVYKELLKSNSGNFLVCPLSVDTVLALVHSGAKGETAKQISSGLNLPESPDKVQEIFKHITTSLQGNNNYNLSSANKVYLNDGFEIIDSFKQSAVDVFDAEIQTLDFGKKEQAAGEINKWVEEKTHDKIKNLIKPDDLSAATRSILVNAMFFQGIWVKKFKTFNTEKKSFHLNSKEEEKVDTMKNTDFFKYYESQQLNAKLLELPYKGSDVSMFIVLPNDIEGLSALETKMVDVFHAANGLTSFEHVTVELPKFKIDTIIKFVPILKSLGIEVPFDDAADFSGMTPAKVSIGKVVQKAFIEVDEDGTTAAAATFLDVVKLSALVPLEPPPPPKLFIADHPFIFYLKHRSTILFVGRYVTPK